MTDYMAEDVVIACARLVGRSGASGFEIGHMRDDVPVEEAGWYATAFFQGTYGVVARMAYPRSRAIRTVTTDEHRSPTTAAMALAERLLTGATCRCREPISMSDDRPGCRWRLVGPEWVPGCDAPPVRVEGQRGDYAAMTRAMAAEPTNRAERRKRKSEKPWKR